MPKHNYLNESPSQTAGPYVHIGCAPNFCGIKMYDNDLGSVMVTDATKGERITIRGTVFDGDGEIVKDAMLEIWQADGDGNHATAEHPNGVNGSHFSGFGRCPCNLDTGEYLFETIKPGATDNQAPHVTIWIVARGINVGLHTRMYFDDEQNGADPILQQIPENRRATMLGQKTADGTYEFNVVLQGTDETVFLDI